MPGTPTLRRARPADWDAIHALLLGSALPVDDLGRDRLGRFLVAESSGAILGFIGLEAYGTVGLLRSLVVEESARGSGLGGRLIGALEAAAATAGIVELWLLTLDAERFFQRHDYQIVARSLAPDVIRRTDEFSGLCPDTAVLMRKSPPQSVASSEDRVAQDP